MVLLITSLISVFAEDEAVAILAEEADVAMGDKSMKVQVNAKAAVLMEASTKRVLMASNENEKLFPASVTKIMTMLLVCEAIDGGKISLKDNVTASENAASKGGSQIWLKVGEVMTVHELLKATAVYSANDACTLLGEYVAGSETAFNDMMNRRAKELGMNNTHFDNCTGLDDTTDTHLTTAYDIALMSAELLKHELIFDYTTIWMDSLRDGATELVNTNKLVRTYKGITGLKTGTTNKAGNCVSATAKRDNLNLIAVVLGSDNTKDRFNGARDMLDWGFANYESIVPTVDMSQLANIKVIHGIKEEINPAVPKMQPIITLKGSSARITQKVELALDVQAPVERGQVLGKIKFYLDEQLLCEYNLCADEEVARMRFFDALKMILRAFSADPAENNNANENNQNNSVDSGAAESTTQKGQPF
jgi:D-alanyl-D-alanine carboxypeptidase (penicillin-binding protein 5/6)